MLKLILLSSVTLLASLTVKAQQTGENKGWPSSERYAFITECIKEARSGMSLDTARFYCYCMQETVEAKYPDVNEAAKLSSEELATPAWQKLVKECLYGYWSGEERDAFLTNCIESAMSEGSGLTKEKATSYCECMLYKIEKKYPNPLDAGNITDETMNTPEMQKLLKGCFSF